MSRLARDGTAEPISRDQILGRQRGQGKYYFPYSADLEQDWQPCLVDPYSAESAGHTYILIVPGTPYILHPVHIYLNLYYKLLFKKI